MLRAVKAAGARLLPVDSEHNAIFQSLADGNHGAVERIVLTASGGPFRTASMEDMAKATPEAALKHPVWSMGAKISINSATLMNKGLEVIEAARLFGLPEERIGVLVHPQSVIHGLVCYHDGSVVAQLGSPDMRIPISHTLAWPERMATPSPRLDLAALARLEFAEPDMARFPALGLARDALRAGGGAPTVLLGRQRGCGRGIFAAQDRVFRHSQHRVACATCYGCAACRYARRCDCPRCGSPPRRRPVRRRPRCLKDTHLFNAMPGFLQSGLAFVVVLGVLVFVHEFGHYAAARWCGVHVEVFSIGFGRAIASWKDQRRDDLEGRLAAAGRLRQAARAGTAGDGLGRDPRGLDGGPHLPRQEHHVAGNRCRRRPDRQLPARGGAVRRPVRDRWPAGDAAGGGRGGGRLGGRGGRAAERATGSRRSTAWRRRPSWTSSGSSAVGPARRSC